MLGENFQATAHRGEPSWQFLLNWGHGAGSSGSVTARQLEFADQSTREERAAWREHRRSAENPPKTSAEYWSEHICEETNEGRGKNHLIRLEGIILKVHLGPGIILVPLARMDNLIIHGASDRVLKILKGQNSFTVDVLSFSLTILF